jgi:hypothetical protein
MVRRYGRCSPGYYDEAERSHEWHAENTTIGISLLEWRLAGLEELWRLKCGGMRRQRHAQRHAPLCAQHQHLSQHLLRVARLYIAHIFSRQRRNSAL